ncbi:hypothetical protein FRC08_014165, partial [Ceratobasidium sp. 394]
MPADAPTDPPLPGPSTSTSKRSARTTKRSPAPRRQECKTCGKKFQRPCQLTTHIRSHTGEQPHACPVCSRRFSVLSNCQRHVKLCQKRSTKVLSPGDEDAAPDSAAGPSGTTSSSFITYPDSNTTEEPVRRPNEIPIRPKIAAHASGNGSSLLGARPAALERPASVASSSVVEGEGAGSEASAVPVVPSSSYSYSSGPGFASTSGSGSGFGYDEAHAFEPPQTIYEEPSSEYASESPYEPAGSGFDAARASSYDTPRAGSAYEPSTSGYAGSGYDSLGSGYGASSSAYGPSGSTYEQPASSGADYQSGATEYGYGDYSHPSPSHVHPSPSHVHIQPHPSPSHVHASSPSVYGTPSMLGTPTVHPIPLMHGDSTFLSPTTPGPGMSVSRSMPSIGNHATVPVSRRASASMARRTTLPAINSHDALGFTTEPVPSRRQTIVPSDSVVQPFVFQRSPAELVNRGLEPEVKHEDEGGDAWTSVSAPAPGFQAGYQSVGGYPA